MKSKRLDKTPIICNSENSSSSSSREKIKNKKNYHANYQKKITQPLQIWIGPTIRIGRESWCLPYARFFLYIFFSNNVCIFLYWCFYLHTFRDSVSPWCKIFITVKWHQIFPLIFCKKRDPVYIWVIFLNHEVPRKWYRTRDLKYVE